MSSYKNDRGHDRSYGPLADSENGEIVVVGSRVHLNLLTPFFLQSPFYNSYKRGHKSADSESATEKLDFTTLGVYLYNRFKRFEAHA